MEKETVRTQKQLLAENENQRARLEEVEETLRAIRDGEVDAIVVSGDGDEEIFTLKSARELLATANQSRLALLSIIEDLKRSEEALRASEEKYRTLVDEVNDGFYVSDEAGIFTFANPALARIYGVEAPQLLLGRKFSDFFASEKSEVLGEAYSNAMQTGSAPEIMNGQIMWPDGTRTFIEVKSAMIKEGDKIVGTRGVVRDVTERKRAEEKIEHQLQHLKALRAIDVAISSSFDIRVTLDIVLQQALSQLGVNAAAILLLNHHEQSMEYIASRGFHHSNAFKHTQLKVSEGYASRVMRERQTIHIPNLLQTEGKLLEAMQLANEDFVDYHGTPLIVKGEVKGILEIYHRSSLSPDPEWLGFLEALAGEAAIAIDNAQLFEGLQRAKAELEQRVAERTEELNQTNIELAHANRTKDEFLATMSHELRTPLNSILGLSELLLEQRRDPLSAHQQKSMQTISDSGNHLLELINDILDLSKIEAGKFDYYPQVVGVDDLCRSSLTFVKEQATRKSITLTYQQQASISKIYADPRRLKQILVNLLTNAVKFTPNHGQVVLQMDGDVEQDRIQFSVIDTGIGIAPEDMQKLFQPFVQIDSRLTREYQGTGLGLALVQKLTDLQGGSVNVESVVGKGSRFIINLPIGKVMPDQQAVSGLGSNLTVSEPAGKSNISFAESASRGIILLAEDNMANIMTIGDYLESHGYQVEVAHDGLEAIMKAQELQPQLILMDIQMPVLNGLEAISRLRSDPRFGSTPIIALTALAMPGDRERCLVVGASEYMSKPVSLKELSQTIDGLLSQKT